MADVNESILVTLFIQNVKNDNDLALAYIEYLESLPVKQSDAGLENAKREFEQGTLRDAAARARFLIEEGISVLPGGGIVINLHNIAEGDYDKAALDIALPFIASAALKAGGRVVFALSSKSDEVVALTTGQIEHLRKLPCEQRNPILRELLQQGAKKDGLVKALQKIPVCFVGGTELLVPVQSNSVAAIDNLAFPQVDLTLSWQIAVGISLVAVGMALKYQQLHRLKNEVDPALAKPIIVVLQ
ncbi:MAG: hypothetical protein SFX18_15865 [Pirellulales bacterium]|nr:hypothetical protein [Pirellulales bacterium]